MREGVGCVGGQVGDAEASQGETCGWGSPVYSIFRIRMSPGSHPVS